MTGYEIRVCRACGLRYPQVQLQEVATRCPACLGETDLVHRQEWNVQPEEKLYAPAKPVSGEAVWHVLLDNIRSAWNVGSILRSADGLGFRHAYLCGITPPADNEAVAKTALGAQDSVSWSYHKDAVWLASGLKNEGWSLHALEEDPHAVDIRHAFEAGAPGGLLIVGNEVTGVDPGLLELSNTIFYIPMRGVKRSFNVATAFAIAAYSLTTVQK